MNTHLKIKMTADQFIAWSEKQSAGRYELAGGEVVKMPAERVRHVRIKYAIARLIEDAITTAKLDYEFLGDGVSLRIDAHCVREPDGCIAMRPAADDESLEVVAPVVVIDVASPSTERDDSQDKLAEYFSLSSVEHYLLIKPWCETVIHHRRNADGSLTTRILRSGAVHLSPPGIVIAVEALLGKP